MRVHFRLNALPVEIEAEADERLVNVLRREFGLQSMKKNCMQGICGSCTILLDDHPVPSCMLPVFAAEGKNLMTLEWLTTLPDYRDIMTAFETEGITLCGFCNASTILTAYALLHKYGNPSEDSIRSAYIGTVCRCTDIDSIIAAIKRVCRLKRNKRREK